MLVVRSRASFSILGSHAAHTPNVTIDGLVLLLNGSRFALDMVDILQNTAYTVFSPL